MSTNLRELIILALILGVTGVGQQLIHTKEDELSYLRSNQHQLNLRVAALEDLHRGSKRQAAPSHDRDSHTQSHGQTDGPKKLVLGIRN